MMLFLLFSYLFFFFSLFFSLSCPPLLSLLYPAGFQQDGSFSRFLPVKRKFFHAILVHTDLGVQALDFCLVKHLFGVRLQKVRYKHIHIKTKLKRTYLAKVLSIRKSHQYYSKLNGTVTTATRCHPSTTPGSSHHFSLSEGWKGLQRRPDSW